MDADEYAPTIERERAVMLSNKRNSATTPGIKDLNAGYFTALPDTRMAMKVMDEIEDLIDDLERACM